MNLKVILVEEQQLIRDGIKSLLSRKEEITDIGDFNDISVVSTELIKSANVILIESRSLDLTLAFLKMIRTHNEQIKIIILSGIEDSSHTVRKMLDADASGYLTKNTSSEELIHAICKVVEGGLYICTAFALRLLTANLQLEMKNVAKSNVILNANENQVLELIAEGLTNREMSLKLKTSVRTIETRRKSLLDKTSTSNTATLIKYAIKNGLLD